MLYGKVFMKFDFIKNKEYIYSQDLEDKKITKINNIGQTFIDFLAKSDDIIKVIEDGIYRFYEKSKLQDINFIITLTNDNLKNLNNFFEYFNFDNYMENYIKEIKDNNNLKIQEYINYIKKYEEDMEHYKSEKYYKEIIENEVGEYVGKKMEDMKEPVAYLDKAHKEIEIAMKKYKNFYGKNLSDNTIKKMYDKNKNHKKAFELIDKLKEKKYNINKEKIEQKANIRIQSNIKKTKKYIKFYRNEIRHYIKENEKTVAEVLKELIENIKSWINFSRYLLINYYGLTCEKSDNNFSPTQRLLNCLLNVPMTYYNKKILELPKTNIIMQLSDQENELELDQFIKENINELIHNDNILLKLNKYKPKIIQEYCIESIEDFIRVSLIQILQSNIKICKCDNCDKLFISVNKSNEKYCTYKFKGEKTCRDLSYTIHLQKNELSNILRKKYRTENAKKNRNKHIPNIEEKFKDWYKKAKEQKELCEKEEITIEEFKKWLEDNSKWF